MRSNFDELHFFVCFFLGVGRGEAPNPPSCSWIPSFDPVQGTEAHEPYELWGIASASVYIRCLGGRGGSGAFFVKFRRLAGGLRLIPTFFVRLNLRHSGLVEVCRVGGWTELAKAYQSDARVAFCWKGRRVAMAEDGGIARRQVV